MVGYRGGATGGWKRKKTILILVAVLLVCLVAASILEFLVSVATPAFFDTAIPYNNNNNNNTSTTEDVVVESLNERKASSQNHVLDLDVLAASSAATELIRGLTETNRSDVLSVRTLTRSVFGDSSGNMSHSTLETFQESEELMDNIWQSFRKQPPSNAATPDTPVQKVVWLVDLIGDSYARGQYRVYERILKGPKRSSVPANDSFYGDDKETYHQHHVLCCHVQESRGCTLALQHFSFNHTLSEQVERQASELLVANGSDGTSADQAHNDTTTTTTDDDENTDGVVCISWQWSKYTADENVVAHLQRYATAAVANTTPSLLLPQGVVLNQGLHCAFRYAGAYEVCSESSRQELYALMAQLSAWRGIQFVVDTAPIVASFIQLADPVKVVHHTKALNAHVRAFYTKAQQQQQKAPSGMAP